MSWVVVLACGLVVPPYHAPGLQHTRPALPRLRQRAVLSTSVNTTQLEAQLEVTAQSVSTTTAADSAPLTVLWRFSRPHTMIGSALCIPALSLYAVPLGTAVSAARPTPPPDPPPQPDPNPQPLER